MKKILSCILSFSILIVGLLTNGVLAVENNEITPYVVAYQGPVYGYCTGARITTQYIASVYTTTRVKEIRSKLEMEGENSMVNSYVVYIYEETNGNITIPYYHHNHDGYFIELTGDFGPCPNP